jgi:hypothetical protein
MSRFVVPENDDDLERLVLYRSKKFRDLLESRVKTALAGERVGFDDFWADVEKNL